MTTINLTQNIRAPLERVFEAYTGFEQAADTIEAIKRVEMLTDGPVRVGTRFNETRVMFGRESTEQMEVTALETNRLVTVSADACGARFDSTFRFRPDSSGTRVDLELKTRPVTWLARLTWPIGWLMMGSMKKMMQTDMDQIGVACEQTPPASAT